MEIGTAASISQIGGWEIIVSILLPMVVALAIFAVYLVMQHSGTVEWLLRTAQAAKALLLRKDTHQLQYTQMNKTLKKAGYIYDEKQDIFYSDMNVWQRRLGYCRLYDEATALMGIVIDCEPVCFRYGGKWWMIELWKGQYDLAAGCEVGVYTTDRPGIRLPGIFEGAFYDCACDDDRLQIAYTAKINGKTLFKREGLHWLLTGFAVGTFCNPSDITMDVCITLKDRAMSKRFIKALKRAGYTDDEIHRRGSTVRWTFDRPKTAQPYTRTEETDGIMQAKNRFQCDMYRDATKGFKTMPEKIAALRKQYPKIYERIMDVGKSQAVFVAHKAIRIYLS